jgi:hypothetical protein
MRRLTDDGTFFNSKYVLSLDDETQKDGQAKSYNKYSRNSVDPLHTLSFKLVTQGTDGTAQNDPP